MADIGVDVLISAPQKGWSGPPCAGLVMLASARASASTPPPAPALPAT
jgi:aspartate aminotransferase-like enzyme